MRVNYSCSTFKGCIALWFSLASVGSYGGGGGLTSIIFELLMVNYSSSTFIGCIALWFSLASVGSYGGGDELTSIILELKQLNFYRLYSPLIFFGFSGKLWGVGVWWLTSIIFELLRVNYSSSTFIGCIALWFSLASVGSYEGWGGT